eukprot:TRINITY_DN1414_c0_g1_i1.p2 TRINITY_DN1414_c0_g1~~TRINITY_DN1414_c0_g1_i1.p2  ORF type:complete len:58 (+),score=5.11 TRINITY_DN1414_c0_g1_i1:96-269(+)
MPQNFQPKTRSIDHAAKSFLSFKFREESRQTNIPGPDNPSGNDSLFARRVSSCNATV